MPPLRSGGTHGERRRRGGASGSVYVAGIGALRRVETINAENYRVAGGDFSSNGRGNTGLLILKNIQTMDSKRKKEN